MEHGMCFLDIEIPFVVNKKNTRIYDADPQPGLPVFPGALPPDIDPPLEVPRRLPAMLPPSKQERHSKTPVYDSLT